MFKVYKVYKKFKNLIINNNDKNRKIFMNYIIMYNIFYFYTLLRVINYYTIITTKYLF